MREKFENSNLKFSGQLLKKEEKKNCGKILKGKSPEIKKKNKNGQLEEK